jgi:GrpB-like predicted nucleotidyltransferase (UPF0157 family)
MGTTSIVRVVDYDPAWVQTFAALKRQLVANLQGIAVTVEQVGSTSVPGLSAKPVIDIDIVPEDWNDFPMIRDRLHAAGYTHRGDLGIPEREMFDEPTGTPRHNLYVCRKGSTSLRNHLLLRDYLRSHPQAAEEYGRLKKELAQRFPNDVANYCSAKTDFITECLRACGVDEQVLEGIRLANRPPT